MACKRGSKKGKGSVKLTTKSNNSSSSFSLLYSIFQIYPTLTLDEILNRFKDLFPSDSDMKKISKPEHTTGQKLSDGLTKWAGSWTFIIVFGVILVIWMGVNSWYLLNKSWDPYPYILLNLVLSCLAAIQAPIILMSQNRAAERDRHKAELDYMVNRRAERNISKVMTEIQSLKRKLNK